MRRVEQLITQVRRATENTRIGTQDGISDEEFIQYLNDGQELCQSNIIKAHSSAFTKESTPTPDGTEYISIPSDIWMNQRIISVEFSSSGNASDYYPLQKVPLIMRRSVQGVPTQYEVRGSKILVNSYPASGSGSYRLNYDFKLPRLDKRRGTVASRTFAAPSLSALTITPSGLFLQADYDLFDQISIVTAVGAVEMSGIAFTAVSAAGVLTMSTFTAQSGETCTVGSYVCLGVNATTTSQLNDACEKFMLAYCQRRILDRDSSDDRVTMSQDEQAMMADIVSNYSDISGDIDQIPITNYDYFDAEEIS